MECFVVYILASKSRVLYIGVTSRLKERVWEHKAKLVRGFSAKYNVDRLVHYEIYNDPCRAITREKQLKGVRRERKIGLIERENPGWRDLYDDI